ncbi:MAG: ribosomal protein S4e [Cenarchaeum symbiont of Oopsacas minuta]|nr:ribosomal protein S4e [Cenarchaeum symbiont of Oopsacas minuta]
MVSIAGSKKLKRQMAPQFWGITRKDKRFVVTVKPGAHQKEFAIPLAVFLRDTLKIVKTLREAKASIYGNKLKVDGVVRKSLHHGLGLMDVIELNGIKEVYRMVPHDGAILKPVKIDSSEKSKKICRVTSKTTLNGGKMQVGLHDGRSIITDADVSVGDSCVLEIPKQKILEIIKMEPGTVAIVTRGVNVGQLGTIKAIKNGTFTLPKMVSLELDKRQIEIPTGIIIPVGSGKPILGIGR